MRGLEGQGELAPGFPDNRENPPGDNTPDDDRKLIEAVIARLGHRTITLVGMMGAGKSTVGRRLATRLGLPFVDADNEIEAAAGLSIPEIFATRGEADFRAGERRVMARLLRSGPRVLATGGGAFLSKETRRNIRRYGISIWLKADFDVLMRRVRKRPGRPLLQNADPEGTLRNLIAVRYPIYAKADLTVESQDVPHETVVDALLQALDGYLAAPPAANASFANPSLENARLAAGEVIQSESETS